MANLNDRAAHASATVGTGTVTLGAALGAVVPNLCGWQSFANAGVIDQQIVSYLILDSNGNWEYGWGVYSASGTTLTRNVTRSSAGTTAINLSGNEQVFITARAEDLATVEALADANIIVNGGMEVSQFLGTNAINPGSVSYVVDGWQAGFTSAGMTFLAQQVLSSVAGLSNALRLTSTTGSNTVGVSDYATITTIIEGYRVARLGFGAAGAQAITLGFWVRAAVNGTFCVSFRNAPSFNRAFVQNVSYTGAGVAQWCTVTIPGDVTGTWGNTNAGALYITFTFMAGANSQTTAGAWQANSGTSSASQSNFFVNNNNFAEITGVVLLPGVHQLSQEQSMNLIRLFPAEQDLCLRYYEKSYNYATLPGTAGTGASCQYQRLVAGATGWIDTRMTFIFGKKKRTTPTMTFFSPVTGASGKVRDETSGVDVNATAILSSESLAVVEAAPSNTASGDFNLLYHMVADARL